MEDIQAKKLDRLAEIEQELEELSKELSEKEITFCKFYAQNGNKTRSAEMAGYLKSHAHTYSVRLYQKPNIKRYIALYVELNTLDAKASMQEQAWRLQAIASHNVSDYVEVNDGVVTVKSMDELTPEQKYAVKSIKPTKFGIEVHFYDKMQAIEMLNRNLGFYKADNEQVATNTTPTVAILLPDNQRGIVQPLENDTATSRIPDQGA